ncbi:Uncharacterised protein [Stutzerimonas stutzeri]|nr:hypothetical protein [Stutzerimonas stutzeri]CAB5518370.1 Uncharacterised protein [Stutzerimonas stutzeri]CAB5532194.1 Uncharacterised protein [Stutzerimonas stutzeri]CAC9090478.1 Uncharacterised protein [Stutzerimonas stutzeri]
MTISTLLGDGPTDLWVDGTHGRMFVRSWFPERDALRPNHAPDPAVARVARLYRTMERLPIRPRQCHRPNSGRL